jgi:cysteine-rich repeat protein
MKKIIVFLCIAVLLLGIATIVAKDSNGDSDSGSNSNSGSGEGSSSKDNSKSSGKDTATKSESKTETEIKIESGKSEQKTKTEENGKKTETETEQKDGETKTEQKTEYVDEAGNKVTIKTKTVISEGVEQTKTTIKVKGAEVNTKLSVSEQVNQNGDVTIKAKLSTGVEQEIIVMPDVALHTALEELETAQGFTFELQEHTEGEKITTVFSAKAKKTGKVLGLFDTQVDLETLIDTQTGEIIQTHKPWWAFLIIGQNTADVCHVTEGNKRTDLSIPLTALKMHEEHGDTIGICPIICGDGLLIEGKEECDDGNLADEDGCSAVCTLEVLVLETQSPPSETNQELIQVQ